MKKKFFFAAVALVMSAATAVGYKAYDKGNMSEFMMANIEALSENESTSTEYCYDEIVSADGMFVVYCPMCPQVVPGRANMFALKKKCN